MIEVLQTGLLLAILGLIVGDKLHVSIAGKRHRIILDSCSLIDGRILNIAQTGFISSQLVVPKFVLLELQQLADKSDRYTRERARFGLDVVNKLNIDIDNRDFNDIQEVDDKLVAMARKYGAKLMTADLNLAKVAEAQGVAVLNINSLANGLRLTVLPGEIIQLTVKQKGSARGQGIGYLEDGTLVVVDGASKYIGKQVTVVITKVHQSPAGKMVFANIKH